MAEYIKKPWGLTVNVIGMKTDFEDEESKCWMGWMNPGSGTSIHRHSCDSVITCFDGTIRVATYGCGAFPDRLISVEYWVYQATQLRIPRGVWHHVEAANADESYGRQSIFHEWYDLKDGETDYPIERYEGAAS